MIYYKYDPITGDAVEVPARTVVCTTSGCLNEGVELELADDGGDVFCGPCGATLAATSPKEGG